MKLTIDLHLVTRFRMRGALLPFLPYLHGVPLNSSQVELYPLPAVSYTPQVIRGFHLLYISVQPRFPAFSGSLHPFNS